MNRKKCWEENTGNTQNNATEHTKHLPETLCLDFDCCYSCGPHSRWCWSLLRLRKPCVESKYIVYFVLAVIWYSPCWDCASPVWNQDIYCFEHQKRENNHHQHQQKEECHVILSSSISRSSSILCFELPRGHVWKLGSLRPSLFNGVQNLWIKISTNKALQFTYGSHHSSQQCTM